MARVGFPFWLFTIFLQRRFGGNTKRLRNPRFPFFQILHKVWDRTRAAGIPLDAQWTDIDLMERKLDFTLDTKAFAGLEDHIDMLHANGETYLSFVGLVFSKP